MDLNVLPPPFPTRRASDLGWKGVEEAAVLPPDLEQAYEGLPKTGFGRIAVLEAAMTEDKPVLWAIRADGKPAIALAAPARAGETLAGIALVRLPLARATLGQMEIGRAHV